MAAAEEPDENAVAPLLQDQAGELGAEVAEHAQVGIGGLSEAAGVDLPSAAKDDLAEVGIGGLSEAAGVDLPSAAKDDLAEAAGVDLPPIVSNGLESPQGEQHAGGLVDAAGTKLPSVATDALEHVPVDNTTGLPFAASGTLEGLPVAGMTQPLATTNIGNFASGGIDLSSMFPAGGATAFMGAGLGNGMSNTAGVLEAATTNSLGASFSAGLPQLPGMANVDQLLGASGAAGLGSFPASARSVGLTGSSATAGNGSTVSTAVPAEPAQEAPKEAPKDAAKETPGDKVSEDLQYQLDKLAVETMHEMVKEVVVPMGDSTATCKFLYLTNRQATQIPARSMWRVRNELGLGDPKMVIRLMPSRFGTAWWDAFPFFSGRFPGKRVPEICSEAQECTEHQMLLLAKEVILPTAMSARALIVGVEGCALTVAFLKVSASIQNQMRDKCPFRLLIFARAHFFEIKSREKSSIVSNFRESSRRWKDQEQQFDQALKARYGDDEAYLPQTDLPEGKYSLVMFECLNNDDKIADQTPNCFQNDFISALLDIPIIALQTYGTEYFNYLPTMADHVSRGLPLLLIDSRNRGKEPVKTMEECKKKLEEFSEKLHNVQPEGVADWYTTSAIAFVKSVIDRRQKPQHTTDDDGDQHAMWIYQAIDDCQSMRGATAVDDAAENIASGMTAASSNLSAEGGLENKEELVQGVDLLMEYTGGELEWEMEQRQKDFREAHAELQSAETWDELCEKLNDHHIWRRIRGCCFHKYRGLDEFTKKHTWADKKDNGGRPSNKWMDGRYRLVINLGKVSDKKDQQFFQDSKEQLLQLFQGEYDFSSKLDKKKLTKTAFYEQEAKWLALYDLLSAGNVRTGSLHDLARCKKTLSDIAQIEYLPENNSLEALILLRRAWSLYDIFMVNADEYKTISKLAYISMLIISVFTVLVITFSQLLATADLPDTWALHKRNMLLAFSLGGSFIAGLTTTIQPSRKWLGLRGAALTLESEIWKFRTRMGDYSRGGKGSTLGRADSERKAVLSFAQHLTRVQEKVQHSAGLNRTAFYAVATTAPDASLHSNSVGHEAFMTVVPSGKGDSLNRMGSMVTIAPRKPEPHLTHPEYIQHGQFRVKHDFLQHVKSVSKWFSFRHWPCCSRRRRILKDKKPENEDNFHSPALPDVYIKHRLVPMRDFYQSKIPGYAIRYRCFQGFILGSTVLSALIAATTDPAACSIIASLSGLVAAWTEFTAVEKKLDRYSSVSLALENLLLWWQSLPAEEKKSLKSVESLVLVTENNITGASAAWLSDAEQASGKLQSAANKAQGKKDKGDGKTESGQGGDSSQATPSSPKG